MTVLTAVAVDEVFRDCLFQEGEATEPHVAVEGIGTSKFGFHPERLKGHRDDVVAFLMELDETFRPAAHGGGGGWTTLNAVTTKDGEQWAEHRNMEQLCTLAVGLGLGEWKLPKELWSAMPGGMPYFGITEEAFSG